MCKLDLKDAYFSVPLNPASRKFMRLISSAKLYEFLCLCFRLGPAPRIFTKLLKIPVSVLRRLNIRIIIYLDDMLLIGHKIEETLMAIDTVIFLLQQLGFVLNLKKPVLTPTQKIEFLGVTVDLLIMTLSLIQTDESRNGRGAACQEISTGGQSSKEYQLLHINLLEPEAVELALLIFNKQKCLKAVIFK